MEVYPPLSPSEHNVMVYGQEQQLQVMPSLHAVSTNTCCGTASNCGQYYGNLCRPIRVDLSFISNAFRRAQSVLDSTSSYQDNYM